MKVRQAVPDAEHRRRERWAELACAVGLAVVFCFCLVALCFLLVALFVALAPAGGSMPGLVG